MICRVSVKVTWGNPCDLTKAITICTRLEPVRPKTVCRTTAGKSEVETPEGHAACSVIYAYSACARG